MPKGTVLSALYGASIGKTTILNIEACTNQAIASLIPNPQKTLPECLMYYLHTLKTYYVNLAMGVAQPNINTEIMKSVKIPVPPLQIQAEIVKAINDRMLVIQELKQ